MGVRATTIVWESLRCTVVSRFGHRVKVPAQEVAGRENIRGVGDNSLGYPSTDTLDPHRDLLRRGSGPHRAAPDPPADRSR